MARLPDHFVWQLVHECAARNSLDPAIVRAMIRVESGDDACAMRFEPRYRWLWGDSRPVAEAAYLSGQAPLWGHHGVSQRTEWMQQKTSWGLMQVMGAVLRERGCRDRFLSALCAQPDRAVYWGCDYLGWLTKRAADPWLAVGAYNAGLGAIRRGGTSASRAYVTKVRRALGRNEDTLT